MNFRGLDRLGLPGAIGIGCLLFSVVFHVSSVAPVLEQLERLDAEKRQLEAAADARQRERAQAGTARGAMPATADVPAVLKRLAALGEQSHLAMESVSYAMTDAAGIRRLEVSFPLKVGYPQLRAWLRDALELTSTASLDELSLQRLRADDASLDAQVRLSYRFIAPS